MPDSTQDTEQHIRKVQARLQEIISALTIRAAHHDETKLLEPEKAGYDALQDKLAGRDYDAIAWDVALSHHYAHNRHHPEHHTDGIAGMTLLDLAEMLSDWKAASERHGQESVETSLKAMSKRFGISKQFAAILVNTVRELGW
jgi:hypothetical protein